MAQPPELEDTEWNDILRSKGILPPKEPTAQELFEKALDEAIEAHNEKQNSEAKYDDYNLDELDELEDEIDDAILNKYRDKRMAELKELASKQKFGEVYHISKPDFVREVTEASKEAPVVLHLYKDSFLACRQLNAYLNKLSQQYKSTKFVKIISDLCIEGFPDRNLPALLIYDKGEIKQQLIGMASSLKDGLTMSYKDLEKMLLKMDMLDFKESNLEEEEEIEDSRRSIRNMMDFKGSFDE